MPVSTKSADAAAPAANVVRLPRRSGARRVGDSFTASGLPDILYASDQVADFARSERSHGDVDRCSDADLLDIVSAPGTHEPEPPSRHQRALEDPHGADDTAVLVVVGIEDQPL